MTEIQDVNNPHDRLLKSALTSKRDARSFIDGIIRREKLDVAPKWKSLQIVSGTSVSEEMKEDYSDILFYLELKDRVCGFYILVEHKSYHDEDSVIQLAENMLKCKRRVKKWRDEQAKAGESTKSEKYPMVIGVLVVHGKKVWGKGSNFASFVDEVPGLDGYGMDFKFVTLDLKSMRDDELFGTAKIVTTMFLLRDIRQGDKIQVVRRAFELYRIHEGDVHKLGAITTYIITQTRIGWEELKEIASSEFSEKGIEAMKSTYDLTIEEGIAIGIEKGIEKGIEQGIEKGIEQGIEKGRLESLVDCVESILDTKFGKEGLRLMSAIRKIEDIQKLKILQRELITLATPEEVRKFLSNLT
ncbi:MAG: Rpn family recombination-promoting nuclease/putative transposase [Planctomycetes bacterium]|nr:Rpn family recombination-promoting nuclease/putative transposase [Planctomycetota bacterium]